MEARLIFKKALSLPANFRLELIELLVNSLKSEIVTPAKLKVKKEVIDDIWQYAQTSDETFTIEQIEAELIAEEKKYAKAYR